MNGAEVVVDPRKSRVVDRIGGDEKVFGVIALGGNKFGDRGIVDKYLRAARSCKSEDQGVMTLGS